LHERWWAGFWHFKAFLFFFDYGISQLYPFLAFFSPMVEQQL